MTRKGLSSDTFPRPYNQREGQRIVINKRNSKPFPPPPPPPQAPAPEQDEEQHHPGDTGSDCPPTTMRALCGLASWLRIPDLTLQQTLAGWWDRTVKAPSLDNRVHSSSPVEPNPPPPPLPTPPPPPPPGPPPSLVFPQPGMRLPYGTWATEKPIQQGFTHSTIIHPAVPKQATANLGTPLLAPTRPADPSSLHTDNRTHAPTVTLQGQWNTTVKVSPSKIRPPIFRSGDAPLSNLEGLAPGGWSNKQLPHSEMAVNAEQRNGFPMGYGNNSPT